MRDDYNLHQHTSYSHSHLYALTLLSPWQECRESHSPSLISGNFRPRLLPNALGESVQPALEKSSKNETVSIKILTKVRTDNLLK